jgi:hypothetical protein
MLGLCVFVFSKLALNAPSYTLTSPVAVGFQGAPGAAAPP